MARKQDSQVAGGAAVAASEPPPPPSPVAEATPAAAPAPKLWRVSLDCPGPLAHRMLDVDAATEDEAKAKFNAANGVTYSVHGYTIRRVAPGTPMEADGDAVPQNTLQAFALALADELDRAAREFGLDKVRRVPLADSRAKDIAAKLRELAGKR